MDRISSELKAIYGFDTFRGDQKPAIEAALSGRHSLVLMPTGMGKSVCFQLAGRLRGGLTLVLSPLIALMKDQVDQAKKRGFRAEMINASVNKEDRERIQALVKKGQVELLYVTPERFRKPEFLEALQSLQVSLLAVDEAHCISQWGHDFRPDYSRLKEIRGILGSPTTMALTATATREVQKDIIEQLGLAPDEVSVFDHGLERPNLKISVHEVYGTDEKVRAIVALKHQIAGPIIVYVSLISTLEKISRELQKLGLTHFDYHGQLPDKFRRRNQNGFLASKDGLILATPAFGLGIDKPDVRAVIHAEIPGSIESYYQEIGRAGRDGLPAEAVLLYDPDDLTIQTDFIKWANPDPGFYRGLYRLLADRPDQVRQGGLDYLRGELNYYNSRDYRLETALNMMERWGCLEMADNYKDLKVVGELPEIFLDSTNYEKRISKAQMRLGQLAQLARHEGDRLNEIYRYFRE